MDWNFWLALVPSGTQQLQASDFRLNLQFALSSLRLIDCLNAVSTTDSPVFWYAPVPYKPQWPWALEPHHKACLLTVEGLSQTKTVFKYCNKYVLLQICKLWCIATKMKNNQRNIASPKRQNCQWLTLKKWSYINCLTIQKTTLRKLNELQKYRKTIQQNEETINQNEKCNSRLK